MSGRRAKEARRLMRQFGKEVSQEREHHNIKEKSVKIPSGQLDREGFPFLLTFHYVTSTVVIPSRRFYRRIKSNLREGIFQ